MSSALSSKCVPYINGSKRIAIRGVYYLTLRFKSDDSPPDDSNNHKKNQLAVDKLNDLLKSMKKGNEETITRVSKNIELPQPRQLARKADQNQQKNDELNQSKGLGEKLADAATSVAKSIGGDTKKTESELLNLLRIYNNDDDNTSEKKSKSTVQLGDLLSGMKIERTQPKTDSSEFTDIDRAERVRQSLGKSSGENVNSRFRKYRSPMDNYIPINLFGSEPLDIFKNLNDQDNVKLPTWDRVYKKSLQTAVTHPPKNIYEQMIIWTEQGKLWKFPIDNEQGMDNEHKVFFAEHVFLEPIINEWCPKKGPIRHFMELVCVGLSKNPFLTVEEKKDHLNWFRQYFYEKNQLLKDVGAFEIQSLPENVKEYYKPTIPEE